MERQNQIQIGFLALVKLILPAVLRPSASDCHRSCCDQRNRRRFPTAGLRNGKTESNSDRIPCARQIDTPRCAPAKRLGLSSFLLRPAKSKKVSDCRASEWKDRIKFRSDSLRSSN